VCVCLSVRVRVRFCVYVCMCVFLCVGVDTYFFVSGVSFAVLLGVIRCY